MWSVQYMVLLFSGIRHYQDYLPWSALHGFHMFLSLPCGPSKNSDELLDSIFGLHFIGLFDVVDFTFDWSSCPAWIRSLARIFWPHVPDISALMQWCAEARGEARCTFHLQPISVFTGYFFSLRFDVSSSHLILIAYSINLCFEY
jgi:hypothetical protein